MSEPQVSPYVYVYPQTGVPGRPLPRDWDSIPGAPGCTPQSCAFRDGAGQLTGLGASVFYPVFPPQENADDVIAWLRSCHR